MHLLFLITEPSNQNIDQQAFLRKQIFINEFSVIQYILLGILRAFVISIFHPLPS
jgi:hypothetical protein